MKNDCKKRCRAVLGLAGVLFAGMSLYAQTCLTASDMEPATQTSLLNAAQADFDLISRGDSAALQQNAIPGLANNFSAIQTAVKDNQGVLAGAKPVPRSPFLLQAEGDALLAHAEFLCGVFGRNGQTASSAVFEIPNVPPGSYGFVTQDVSTSGGPYTVSYVLEQQSGTWKLGGLYVKPAEVAGHDGNWFADHARDFKTKGDNHTAWLYYQEARELLVPVPFMSTLATDKLYDEAQAIKPSDLPPSELVAGSKSYKLTALFPLAVEKQLGLVVKYQVPDVSNTTATYQENMAVMKALLVKYPALRTAFDVLVARAVEPSGRDYGSMLPMKDIK